MVFDCNILPAIPENHVLRSEPGNGGLVDTEYSKSPDYRGLYRSVAGLALPGFTILLGSDEGLYRAPAVATRVAKMLVDSGKHVLLSHNELPVVSERLTPKNETWGMRKG